MYRGYRPAASDESCYTTRIMTLWRPPAERLLDVAFFAGFLAYAFAGIDTRLIYHWQGSAFYTTPGFAEEFLKYPGGVVDYFYALLLQVYASQVFGSLALTAQAAAGSALTHAYFKVLAGRALPGVRFIPAVFMLASLNLYYDRTPLGPALLLGVAAAIGFVSLSRRLRSETALLVAFVAMLAATYWIGGMAIVFFVPAAAIVQIARRPRLPLGIVYLLAAGALPAAVERFSAVSVPMSAREWFFNADTRRSVVWWGLYLLYAGGTAILTLRRGEKAGRPGRLIPVAAAVAALAGLGVVAFDSYRTGARDRRLAALDYATSGDDWPGVIEASRGLESKDFNSLARYEVNLALHETNRLGDEMFAYPQKAPMLPRLRAENFLPYMIRITDLCLRLGRVNEAEHFGNEAIILGKSDPRVYRLMARLNMVKGQTAAARKFLTALSFNMPSAGWAGERLQQMNGDPQLSSDAEIQLLRRRMLRHDDVIAVWQRPDKPDADMERLLLDQLEQDPSNRTAFEFLMGNYLLGRDMAAIRGLMPRIRQMRGPAYERPDGTRRTPRHYQEAIAAYMDFSGQPVAIDGFEIEPDTLNRMAVFKRIMSQSSGNEVAKEAAWSRFHDSYFFYLVFGPGDYR